MTLIQELEKMADRMPQAAIKLRISRTAHVLRYPMKDILAKVPGDTLKERAEAIGVSRQTMYVWLREKYRPAADQADTISELTGIPVWQIRDLEDEDDDAGTASPKARGRMAKDGKGVPSGKRGANAGSKTRARDKQGVVRRARKVR